MDALAPYHGEVNELPQITFDTSLPLYKPKQSIRRKYRKTVEPPTLPSYTNPIDSLSLNESYSKAVDALDPPLYQPKRYLHGRRLTWKGVKRYSDATDELITHFIQSKVSYKRKRLKRLKTVNNGSQMRKSLAHIRPNMKLEIDEVAMRYQEAGELEGIVKTFMNQWATVLLLNGFNHSKRTWSKAQVMAFETNRNEDAYQELLDRSVGEALGGNIMMLLTSFPTELLALVESSWNEYKQTSSATVMEHEGMLLHSAEEVDQIKDSKPYEHLDAQVDYSKAEEWNKAHGIETVDDYYKGDWGDFEYDDEW